MFYKPVISYTYLVGDKTYHSSKYKNSFVARGEEWVSQRPPKLPLTLSPPIQPGQTVTVTYDPDDPATAYLELDSSISRLFVFRTSGILLLLAAALLFHAQRLWHFRRYARRAHSSRRSPLFFPSPVPKSGPV